MLLGSTRLDVNGTVRARLAVRKTSFASVDEVRALTGMEPGGVSPFGLPAGFRLESTSWWFGGTIHQFVGSGERASKLLVAPGVFA